MEEQKSVGEIKERSSRKVGVRTADKEKGYESYGVDTLGVI